MAYEDFSTWTEVDVTGPTNYPDVVTIDTFVYHNQEEYHWKDFVANEFRYGAFSFLHKSFSKSSVAAGKYVGLLGFTNTLNGLYDLFVAGSESVWACIDYTGSTSFKVFLMSTYGSGPIEWGVNQLTNSIDYDFVVTLLPGSIQLRVYEVGQSSPVENIVLVHGMAQQDFQYASVANGWRTGHNQYSRIYLQNMDLSAAAARKSATLTEGFKLGEPTPNVAVITKGANVDYKAEDYGGTAYDADSFPGGTVGTLAASKLTFDKYINWRSFYPDILDAARDGDGFLILRGKVIPAFLGNHRGTSEYRSAGPDGAGNWRHRYWDEATLALDNGPILNDHAWDFFDNSFEEWILYKSITNQQVIVQRWVNADEYDPNGPFIWDTTAAGVCEHFYYPGYVNYVDDLTKPWCVLNRDSPADIFSLYNWYYAKTAPVGAWTRDWLDDISAYVTPWTNFASVDSSSGPWQSISNLCSTTDYQYAIGAFQEGVTSAWVVLSGQRHPEVLGRQVFAIELKMDRRHAGSYGVRPVSETGWQPQDKSASTIAPSHGRPNDWDPTWREVRYGGLMSPWETSYDENVFTNFPNRFEMYWSFGTASAPYGSPWNTAGHIKNVRYRLYYS